MPSSRLGACRHGRVNRLTLRDLLQILRRPLSPPSLDGGGPFIGRRRHARTRSRRRRSPGTPRPRTRRKIPPNRQAPSHGATARAPAIGRRRLPRPSRPEPLRGAASAASEKTPSRPNSPNPRAQQLHRARAVLTSAASMRLAAAASRSAMSRRRRSPSRLSSHGMYSRASTSAHVGGTIPSRSALRETTRRRCSSRSARTHSTATSSAPV